MPLLAPFIRCRGSHGRLNDCKRSLDRGKTLVLSARISAISLPLFQLVHNQGFLFAESPKSICRPDPMRSKARAQCFLHISALAGMSDIQRTQTWRQACPCLCAQVTVAPDTVHQERANACRDDGEFAKRWRRGRSTLLCSSTVVLGW